MPDVGLFLRHVCNPNGENRGEVEIQSINQLLRLETNIGQISFLNDYQYAAMTVEEVVDESGKNGDEEAEAGAKKEVDGESKTGDESGTENNPDLTGTDTGEEGKDNGTGEAEVNPVEGADAANGESDAVKDAAPPAATKKGSHSRKTKEG